MNSDIFYFCHTWKKVNFGNDEISREWLLQISRGFWQIRKILPPQNLFCSIYLISLSAKLFYVFFSLVSVLKRIILLFNTVNCEQYKSELYWFSYYISSNFEKLRFVPATITLDISIQIWQLPKYVHAKILKFHHPRK